MKEVRAPYSLCPLPPSHHASSRSPVLRIVESIGPSHLQLVGNLETFGQTASFAVLRFPSYSSGEKNQSCPTHVVAIILATCRHLLLPPQCPLLEFCALVCAPLRQHFIFLNIKTIPAPFPSVIGSLSFYLRYIFQRMKIFLFVYHIPQPHCASHSASECQAVLAPHPLPHLGHR